MNLLVKRLSEHAILPRYAHRGDAGLDLHAISDARLAPGVVTGIGTGIAVAIPDGYEGQVRGRSGLLFNAHVAVPQTGTIDSGYRGEILVALINHGRESVSIKRGDRIAQLVISPVARCVVMPVSDFDGETERGTGGLGSTGR